MTGQGKNSAVLIGALALVVAGVAAAWLALGGDAQDSGAPPPPQLAPAAPPAGDAPREPASTLEPAETARGDEGAKLETTVAWPVKVELELVSAEGVPSAGGVPPLGSGRNARIRGIVLDRSERGVAAEVRFASGLNAGRTLRADGEGRFGATDLYPGLAEVRITGPGIPGSVREVRLSGYGECELNVSYGLPGSIYGSVVGPDEKPLEGVSVELDGQRATTDAGGEFYFPSMTAGDNLLLVLSKRGYATFMERTAVPAGRAIPRGQVQRRLEPSASLEVAILDRAGGPGEAQIVLLPANFDVGRTFPWHRLSPASAVPGSSRHFEDLPATRVSVRVYHPGAVADPDHGVVTLRPGQTQRHEVHMRAAFPTAAAAGGDGGRGAVDATAGDASRRGDVKRVFGKVTDERGVPVSGAIVLLETPDRAGTAVTYLANPGGVGVLEKEMIPTFGPLAQEARTDGGGNYLLTAWTFYTKAHYVTARTVDGRLQGYALVPAGEVQADVVVRPVQVGKAKLSLRFPGRHQGLPVLASVDGLSLGERVLAPDEALELSDLARGTWRLRATWHGQPVQGAGELALGDDLERDLRLPQGAIDGQDPDTLLRARRE